MSKENHRKKKEILMKRIKGGKYTPKRPTRNREEKEEEKMKNKIRRLFRLQVLEVASTGERMVPKVNV